MTVKLALLKSGEQVISDIKELVNDDQKVLTLVFTNPYVVQFLTPELLYEEVENQMDEVNYKVSFSPWFPLSSDKVIPVSNDWVVSIVEPLEWIKTSYEEKMNKSVEGEVNDNLPTSPSTDSSKDYNNIEILMEETNG
jgi:hypothetical protein